MTRSSISTSALAVVLVLAARPAPASPGPSAGLPTGPQLLRRVLLTEGRVPFVGRQVVTVPGGRTSITREWHYGAGRSCARYVAPPDAVGRTVVIGDGRRWEYEPAHHLAIRAPQTWNPPTPSTVAGLVRRVCRSYRVAATNSSTLSGRRVWMLRMTPLANDRDTRTWWVDRATGVVIQREVRDPDGLLQSRATFRDLQFGRPADPAMARFTPPPHTRVLTRAGTAVVTSLSEARRMAPSWARIPDTMGAGFDFDSARRVAVKGTPGLYLRYSDGLVALSLIQVRGRSATASRSRAARTVRVGGTPATINEVGTTRVLTWSDPRLTYNLVADLAEPSLLRIARQLR